LETSDKIFELFMAHKQSSGDFLWANEQIRC
jgi:hypothetical protein